MRLFNRAKEEAADQANAPPTLPGIAPMGSSASPSPPAPPKADAPKGPDPAVLDASVREMSEKIARLTSSLESVSTEKQTFEDKIERMEERMRKLASLTEMLSAQYNPFVGDAPSERAPLRADGASMAASMPAAMAPPEAKPEPPAPESPEERVHVVVSEPEPEWQDAEAPAPALEDESPSPMVAEAERDPAEGASPSPPHAPLLARVTPGFQSSMLLLNWSETLLKATGSREGLHQVLRYYASLRWVSEEIAETLAAYAEGLASAEDGHDRDWRGDAELHERSLLFIEKLKGRAG